MTLTFEPATWVLFATHCLVIVNICAKLFSKPPCTTKLWAWQDHAYCCLCTKLSTNCDLDLWPKNMVLVCETLFCHDIYLFSFFSYPIMHDNIIYRTQISFSEAYAPSLRADCDLDVWPKNMVLVFDTSSCHENHLWQIIFKSYHAWQSYWPDTNSFTEADA